MKLLFLFILAIGAGVPGFSYPMHGRSRAITVEPEVIALTLPDALGKTLAELTLEEHLALASGLSVERQKQSYVRFAGFSSLMVPGSGQLITGNFGEAALFMGLNVLITGATIVGIYSFTPPELWDYSLTYGERKTVFKDYKQNLTAEQALPVIGIMAGGHILNTITRHFSARRAVSQAEQNIENGVVKFEPMIAVPASGTLYFGVGMKMY